MGSLGGAAAPAAAAADDDDDVDLFGSSDEEESEEKKRITEERLAAYHAKKANKPKVIAKTSVLLDVKPWDDETPHEKMIEACRASKWKVLSGELTNSCPLVMESRNSRSCAL